MLRISFDVSEIADGAEASIFEPARCGPDVITLKDDPHLGVDATVTLEEADERLPVLRRILSEQGHGWSERHEDLYTEDELDSARLLLMSPREDRESEWWMRRMRYNWSAACQMCGNGARQTSAMTVDGESPARLSPHRAGVTSNEYLLVDEALATDLGRSGATGLFFRPVYALMPDGRRVELRWKQVCAERTLPQVSPRTTGFTREGACEVCRKLWYFEPWKKAPRLVYRASDLRDAGDVNMSTEHRGFGGGGPSLRDSLLWAPWTLVTPKVRRVFLAAGVTSFNWLPIRVEDADGNITLPGEQPTRPA